MEPPRFDALSRIVGRPHSRRTTLALLTTGPLALRGMSEAETRRKKKQPCKGKPDDTPCKGDGRCLSGVCQPKPACLAFGDACSSPDDCCTHACYPHNCLSDGVPPGGVCRSTGDCDDVYFSCVGYVCMTTACPAASDFCTDGAPQCGHDTNGLCLRPLGGGDTRCGRPSPETSCGCTSHRQCSDRFGAGAFCVKFERGGACNCKGKTTFCAVPA